MAEMVKKEIELAEFIGNFKDYVGGDIAIKPPRYNEENARLLRQFCQAKISRHYISAWEILIEQLPPAFLSDEILTFLIDNRIGLDLLGHKDLSNDLLLKIYNADNGCDEALLTVARRFLSEESDVDTFKSFVAEYPCERLYDYLLKEVPLIRPYTSAVLAKIRFLIQESYSHFDVDSGIVGYASGAERYLNILSETDPNALMSSFDPNDWFCLLALSMNRSCPENILRELTQVQDIKFARQIRANAVKLLHSKS